MERRKFLEAAPLAIGGALILKPNTSEAQATQTPSNYIPTFNVTALSGVDPTGNSDSSAAIQAVLSAATGDLALYFPYGRYLLANLTWDLPNRLTFQGDGPATALVLNSSNGSIMTASAGFFTAQDMTVEGRSPGYVTGGNFFSFANGRHTLRRIDAYNGCSLASWGGGCTGGGACDITCAGMSGSGFTVNVSQSATGQQYGILEFSRLNFQGGPTNNGYGLDLISGDTVIVTDANIAQFEVAISAMTNSEWSYLANLFFTNVLCDGAGGPSSANCGWYFDGTAQFLGRVFLTNCWAGSIPNVGMYFKNVKTVKINAQVIDNGSTGILIDTGCRDVRINDSVITGNSSANPGVTDGIQVLSGADRIHINGCRIGPTYNGINTTTIINSQRYGINISNSTIVNYSIIDNDCSGNISGGINNSGGGQSGVTTFVEYNTQGSFTP